MLGMGYTKNKKMEKEGKEMKDMAFFGIINRFANGDKYDIEC